MAELGRRGGIEGGRVRTAIDVLDDDEASDRLRAKAKRALEQALDSEDAKERLAAARALYSIRSAAPPDEEGSAEANQQAMARWEVNLEELKRLFWEIATCPDCGNVHALVETTVA
jgi:hypothetical protein